MNKLKYLIEKQQLTKDKIWQQKQFHFFTTPAPHILRTVWRFFNSGVSKSNTQKWKLFGLNSFYDSEKIHTWKGRFRQALALKA